MLPQMVIYGQIRDCHNNGYHEHQSQYQAHGTLPCLLTIPPTLAEHQPIAETARRRLSGFWRCMLSYRSCLALEPAKSQRSERTRILDSYSPYSHDERAPPKGSYTEPKQRGIDHPQAQFQVQVQPTAHVRHADCLANQQVCDGQDDH
jgi:hypothetical protein